MNLCSALLTTINEAAMKQTGKPLPGFTLKDGKLTKKPPRMSVSKRIAASKSKRVRTTKRVKGGATAMSDEYQPPQRDIVVVLWEAALWVYRAADEIERLRAQIGVCPNTTDGKHSFAAYQIGTDGKRVTQVEPFVTTYASGMFCQHCGKQA